jgi:G3E family GTPase
VTGTPLPLTVLAGYLGAGKTTRLNRMLTDPHAARTGVLVNDFGSINIDEGLIDSRGERTIGLSNGCVCCSIEDDLGGALDALVLHSPPLERVVLEASGVADPIRLTNYAQTWPGYTLASVIVVADIRRVRKLSNDKYVGETVRRQLVGADQIILSHADESNDSFADSMEWLWSLVPHIPIIADPLNASGNVSLQATRLARHDAVDGAPPAVHTTTTVLAATPLDSHRIRALAAGPPHYLERAKGWLYQSDDPGVPYRLQGIPGSWTLTREPAMAMRHPGTQVVLIWSDPNIEPSTVQELFRGTAS